jgi:orotidine-5'-phosphate decarboxylase
LREPSRARTNRPDNRSNLAPGGLDLPRFDRFSGRRSAGAATRSALWSWALSGATLTLLAVALDTGEVDQAMRWARLLGPHVDVLKVGLELLIAAGPDIVARAGGESGRPVFLDLKLDDIPRSVSAAVRAAARLGVAWLTVHTGAGDAACRAAVDAAHEGSGTPPAVLGVTVLTSLGGGDLQRLGWTQALGTLVDQRARLAAAAGMDGVICAGPDQEVVAAASPALLRVVPGVRSATDRMDDQTRVTTASEAAAAGAAMVVVGRPITHAEDPVAGALAVRRDLDDHAGRRGERARHDAP